MGFPHDLVALASPSTSDPCGPQFHLSHNKETGKGRAGDWGFASECPSGRQGPAGPAGVRGVRPYPAPRGRPSPALGPAYPRVDPSLARFACGCCGARARPRSGQREAAVTGAGLRTCQTRGAGLELRALQARDRPRSPAAPGRAVRPA